MAEHLAYTEKAAGSSPAPPTTAPSWRSLLAALLLALALVPAALAQGGQQAPGSWQLLTGQSYLDLPEYDRELYVTGLNDAYNWSGASGFERLGWLAACSDGKPGRQLRAMFDKWLEANPERWQEPAAKLYSFALFALCRAGPG